MAAVLSKRSLTQGCALARKGRDLLEGQGMSQKTDRLHTWPGLIEGRLIRRTSRFIAEVRLAGGQTVQAHCPNTGRMRSCCEPGRRVFLSQAPSGARRTAYTWELIAMPRSFVVVNTQLANAVVAAAVSRGRIPELGGYLELAREVPYGENSRIDLRLRHPHRRECFVEVKSCTLVDDGVAMFPDAVTVRGRKHLRELTGELRRGGRCCLVYLVQRMDARGFRVAGQIDAAYADELHRAVAAGLEVLVYAAAIDLKGIGLAGALPQDRIEFRHS